ncbi:MAG: NAD(P)H-dependent glycerol-3-phosphate dehydrogenase [Rhizomicrobium sp.]
MDKNVPKTRPYEHIGVLGAGAWGTALALVAAQAGRRVTIWGLEPDVVDTINTRHENTRFLPDVRLPDSLAATGSLDDLGEAGAILVVAPAQHLRGTLEAFAGRVRSRQPIVLCAKGIERGSGKMLTEVLAECAPEATPAILSGPSFARDVARRLPTAVTIASRKQTALRLQESLGHPTFRPYASSDLTGVALGGAAKNVYAIACGIVSGLGLGDSARAALLARSFAELCRLGSALGAKSDTLMGLSGLGDLVLTATSSTSRNYSFGFHLGEGRSRRELTATGQPLAEGVETAAALVARAGRHDVELPVAEAVADILEGRLSLEAAVPRLMARPFKSE